MPVLQREGRAPASSSRAPMASASRARTGAIEWRTAPTEQMKEPAVSLSSYTRSAFISSLCGILIHL